MCAPEMPAPLTGERNESSVLFSLATLAKQAPPPATNVTESSALIDIRALRSPSGMADAPASAADDLVGLSGGGAFAPAYAPLFAPPVTLVPPPPPLAARSRTASVVMGSIALAVVATVGTVVTFASARAASSASEVTTPKARGAIAPSALASDEAIGPRALAGNEAPAPSVVASDEASAPGAVVTPGSAGAPSTARTAPVVRPAVRVGDAPPVASPVASAPTKSGAPRCCPGESETACHMRLSVGVACGGEPTTTSTTSTTPATTSAPPFDRPAAARALAIRVASCKRPGGPTGAGHAKVTFQPSGAVSAVDVEAPYSSTATGACIAQRYRGVSVPAFSGGPLTVGKSFVIE